MDIERSQGVKFTRAWKDMKVMEKRDGMVSEMENLFLSRSILPTQNYKIRNLTMLRI